MIVENISCIVFYDRKVEDDLVLDRFECSDFSYFDVSVAGSYELRLILGINPKSILHFSTSGKTCPKFSRILLTPITLSDKLL